MPDRSTVDAATDTTNSCKVYCFFSRPPYSHPNLIHLLHTSNGATSTLDPLIHNFTMVNSVGEHDLVLAALNPIWQYSGILTHGVQWCPATLSRCAQLHLIILTWYELGFGDPRSSCPTPSFQKDTGPAGRDRGMRQQFAFPGLYFSAPGASPGSCKRMPKFIANLFRLACITHRSFVLRSTHYRLGTPCETFPSNHSYLE